MIFAVVWWFMTYSSHRIISEWNIVEWEVTGYNVDYDSEDWETYAPIVKYECWWKEMEQQSSLYTSSVPIVWANIFLYCSDENPEKFVIDNFNNKYFWYFFLTPWIIVLILWIWLIYYFFYRNRTIAYLKKKWIKIETTITQVYESDNVEVNWKNPLIIESQYIDRESGNTYNFKSDYIWDKSIWNILKAWNVIDVLVDENDYSKYFVCVE